LSYGEQDRKVTRALVAYFMRVYADLRSYKADTERALIESAALHAAGTLLLLTGPEPRAEKTPPKVVQGKQRHRRKERSMIGVFVKLQYRSDFEEKAIREIAESARAMFEGMPALRLKAFTVSSDSREAINFYIWDSEVAARSFFTKELIRKIAGLYGVSPTIEFVSIAALVENMPA
jgi:hypothetical protein